MHVVGNEMKWSTFLCATLYNTIFSMFVVNEMVRFLCATMYSKIGQHPETVTSTKLTMHAHVIGYPTLVFPTVTFVVQHMPHNSRIFNSSYYHCINVEHLCNAEEGKNKSLYLNPDNPQNLSDCVSFPKLTISKKLTKIHP